MTLTRRVREYKMRIFPITRMRFTLGQQIKDAIGRLESPTWVHFHSVFCPEFSSIARVLRKRGLRYGVTPHGGYSQGVMKKGAWKKKLYVIAREQRYLSGASWIQALGAGEVDDILSIAPGANVGVVPNGQQLDLLEGIEIAQMQSVHPVIGYCGRLTIEQKGLDYLLIGRTAGAGSYG